MIAFLKFLLGALVLVAVVYSFGAILGVLILVGAWRLLRRRTA